MTMNGVQWNNLLVQGGVRRISQVKVTILPPGMGIQILIILQIQTG